MMNEFAKFVDKNRQMGSTTRLVGLAVGCDGYLVVHSIKMKNHLLEKHPRLNPELVVTKHQILSGDVVVDKARPIFVDAAVLC